VQYWDLNKLQDKYKAQGFTIVGFPCAQFGLQEIAQEGEILNCLKFVRPGNAYPGPNFPLSGKVMVNGESAHPLYQWLKERGGPWDTWTDHTWLTNTGAKTLATVKGAGSDVPWNFHKFIVSRDGRTVRRFSQAKPPLDAELCAYIEEQLAEPAQ